MKWSEGDKVMAKWPGTGLYFHAVILTIKEHEDSADVKFEDGSEMTLPIKSLLVRVICFNVHNLDWKL